MTGQSSRRHAADAQGSRKISNAQSVLLASTRATRALVESLERRSLLHAEVVAVGPTNGATTVAPSSNITITFDHAMNASTISASTVQLRDSSNNLIPASVTYNSTTKVATLDPTGNLASTNNYFYARVIGGSAGVKSSDGGALGKDYVWSFSTGTGATFTESTVFNGLNSPTAIEFSPDGRVYVAEKRGVIKMFSSLTATTPTTVLDFRTKVHNYWDRGLLGMTLDPQFTPGRPYIYILYTYDAPIGGTAPVWGTANTDSDPGPDASAGNGSPVSGRLSRITVNSAGVMTGSEQVLIEDWGQQFPSHSIGHIAFGNDGYLYASGGDGASFNAVDYGQFNSNPVGDPTNEGGAVRSQDIRSTGDPTGLGGSVVRVDPNTGAAAPGNPNTTGDTNAKRIIAAGLRNPFRFAIRPGTNELWIGDVGWNNYEEINRIVSPTDLNIENFGWPAYEGPARQGGYDAANLPLLESFYAAGASAHSAPYYAYAHSEKVVVGSPEPTGGSSITGAAFYNGGYYPAAYDGAFFFADYARKQIYIMYAGANGLPDPATRKIFKSTANGAVELQVGPNGDLFYVDMGAGRIQRFTVNSATNRPPVAVITSNTTAGNLPLTINYSGLNSTDADPGDAASLAYEWDLDGDGLFNDSTSASPSWTYTTAGPRTVRLRVTDRGGASSVATLVVTPGNTAPVPVINTPTSSVLWKVGDLVSFAGGATDAEDGTLGSAKLSWSLVLIHANEIDPNSTHEHPIQSFDGISSGTFSAPDHEYPSWLVLRLTATDSGGLSATTSLRIDPMTVSLNFASDPSGLTFGFNGDVYPTPFSKTVIVNSTNTLSASSPQTLNGITYTFAGWANNNTATATRTIVAPESSVTYTANYVASLPPNAPTGLSAAAPDYAQVTLAWTDNATNETGYRVERRLNGATTWTTIAANLAVDTTTFSDTGVQSNTSYQYRVVAYNDSGDSVASNIAGITTPLPTQAPFGGTPRAVTSQIEVEDFDFGGESVAYHDNTPENSGGQYRNEDVDIETTGDSSGNYNVGWADSGDWLEYTVTVATAGTYSLSIRVSSPGNGGMIRMLIDGNDLTGPVSVPNTGGWQNWQTVTVPNLSLPAGQHVLRLVMDTNSNYGVSGNFNWFKFTQQALPPTSPTGLTATPTSASQINLAWTDTSNNETGFKIERKTGAAGTWAQVATVGSNVTTYQSTGLSSSTQYYFRVRATGAGGDSDYSPEANATTQAGTVQPPAAPTNLLLSVISASQINLAWTDNAGNESGFKVEQKIGAGSWTQVATVGSNVTSYQATSLSASTQYSFRVRATNSGGDSAYTNEPSATTLSSSNQTPYLGVAFNIGTTPVTIQAEDFDNGGQNISWFDKDSNNNGGKYRNPVEVDIENTSDTGGGVNVGWMDVGEWLEYTASVNTSGNYTFDTRWANPGTGGAFHLEVDGVNVTGPITTPNTGGWQTWQTVSKTGVALTAGTHVLKIMMDTASTSGTPGNLNWMRFTLEAAPTAPAAPSGLGATAASYQQINLAWNDNATNETGFKIERKTGATGTWAQIGTVGSNVTAYQDTTVAASTQYYYRVRATNAAGDSAYSAEANATTPAAPVTAPSAPTNLLLTAASTTQINLVWTDNASNESGFKIERRLGTTGTWAQIATVGPNVTTYQNTGLAVSTQYSYRVRATNAGGDSAYSNEATATTQSSPQTPYLGTPFAIGSTSVTIQAEDFDNGGQNVAWFDADSGNNGGQYRSNTDVDIENTSDTGGGANVGWMDVGEWLEYSVNVAQSGNYTFDARWANPGTGAKFHLELDGTDITGPITAPNTGGWQAWQTVSTANVPLLSGAHVIRLKMDTQSTSGTVGNVNWLRFLLQPAAPAAPTAPSGLTATDASTSQINLAWTDNANNETGFKIERKTGVAGTWAQVATVGANVMTYQSTGLTADTQYYFRVRATNASGDSAFSAEANATTQAAAQALTTPAAPAASGDGLSAVYFDNMDLTGKTVTRIDPMVNFDWAKTAPVSGIGADTFSIRWTGQVLAQFSEKYTFHVAADDGIRLWVNGVQLINKWGDQNNAENSGSITLTAGHRYDIKLEYNDNTGSAMCQLRWSSPSVAKQIIPQANLFSSATAGVAAQSTTVQDKLLTGGTTGTTVLQSK